MTLPGRGNNPQRRDLMRELGEGHQITEVWQLRRADGTYISLELSHAFIPDGLWQAIHADVHGSGRASLAVNMFAFRRCPAPG
jgi:hypothetical protein